MRIVSIGGKRQGGQYRSRGDKWVVLALSVDALKACT